jgi:two-component system response regulator QseB
MRLLLIEDDPMIGKSIRQGLFDAGFAVDWVRDGGAAELALRDAVYDLAVLDLGLPTKDGMSLLESVRRGGNHLPILVATARDAVASRIAGLNAGADDYLVKPFDMEELIARIRALLRRHAGAGSSIMAAGDLVLDPVRKTVNQAGTPVSLSPREFALLEALMQRPGAVLSREKLEESMYGWGEEIGSNAVEVHLHNLRRKLGASAIVNVRGVGYRVAD